MTKDELHQLVDARKSGTPLTDASLNTRVTNAEDWTEELAGLNYFLSQILERKKKLAEPCIGVIEVFYDLENQMSFVAQEFDFRFIDFMLRTLRDKELSLEEQLVILQNNVGEFRYDRTLHFGYDLTDLTL